MRGSLVVGPGWGTELPGEGRSRRYHTDQLFFDEESVVVPEIWVKHRLTASATSLVSVTRSHVDDYQKSHSFLVPLE